VIDSFIRRAVDEGRLDPDDLDERSDNVFWDRTTIRAALGGLIVLILVNLFFFYNMRLEQVDNTSEWVPERRGFLVEYREGLGEGQATGNSSGTLTEVPQTPIQTLPESPPESQPEMPAAEEQEQTGEPQSVTEPTVSVESVPSESSSSSTQIVANQQTVSPGVMDSGTEPDGSEVPVSPIAQIRELVDLWAQTWSFQMVDDYLDLYSSDFVSQGGAPYEPWAELR
ncbi:MAG: hypothetical protein RLN96_03875, partial [Pseudomonadales bacterium]